MKQKSNILILYYELAEYTLACIRALSQAENTTIHVVRYPLNKEAPFQFDLNIPNTTFYSRNELSNNQIKDLVKHLNPEITYCGGWMDKGYLKAIEGLKKNGKKVLLAFDNHWRGDIKQIISVELFKLRYKKLFTHCFIPGTPQKEFAKRLGFNNNEIFEGVYAANTNKFNELFVNYSNEKKNHFPHIFIYAARYYSFKGITDLWEAFTQLKKESPNDWQLWCLGTGDIAPIVHDDIKHYGFVQPDKMEEFIQKTGVYLLPSRFEPWAVSVHEFAAAGFPLVLSSAVGAKTAFLQSGKNGYEFKSENIFDLKKCLSEIISKSDPQLIEMGKLSNQLAQKISPQTWASIFVNLLSKE